MFDNDTGNSVRHSIGRPLIPYVRHGLPLGPVCGCLHGRDAHVCGVNDTAINSNCWECAALGARELALMGHRHGGCTHPVSAP